MRRRSEMTSEHADRMLLVSLLRQQQQHQMQQHSRTRFVAESLLVLSLLCIQWSTTSLASLSASLPENLRHKVRQRSLLRITRSKHHQQYQQQHWQRHLPQISEQQEQYHRQVQGNNNSDNDTDSNTMTIIRQYFGSCILLLGKYDADQNSIINYTEFYNIVYHVCDTTDSTVTTNSSAASAVIPSTNSTKSTTNTSIWDDVFHTAACTCQLYDDDSNDNSSNDCCSNRTSDNVIYRPGKYSSNYTYSICNDLYSNFIRYDCIYDNDDSEDNEPVTAAPMELFPSVPTAAPTDSKVVDDGEYNDNQNTTTNDIGPTTTSSNDNNMESWMIALLTLLSVSVVSMVLYIKVSNNRNNGDNNNKNRKSNLHNNDDTDSTTGIAVEPIAKGSIVPAAPTSKSKKSSNSKRKYDTTISSQTTAVIKKKKNKRNTTTNTSSSSGTDNNIIGIAPPTYSRIDDDETDDSTHRHHHDDEEVMIVLVNTNKTASSEEDNDDEDGDGDGDGDGDDKGGVLNDNRTEKNNGIPTVVINKDVQNHETNSDSTIPKDSKAVTVPSSTSSVKANNDGQKQKQQQSMTYKNYEHYFHDTTSSSSGGGGLMHLANTNDLMYSGSYQYFNANAPHSRSVGGNKHPATMNTITEVLNDSSSSSSTSDDHTTSSDHDIATRMDPLNDIDNNNDDIVDGSSSSDYSTSSESSTTTSSSSSTCNDNNNSKMNPVTSSENSLKLSSRQQLNAIQSTATAPSEDESESSSSSASMSSAGVVSNTSSMIPLLSDPLLLPKLQPTILDHGIDNTSLSLKRSRPTTIITTTTARTTPSSNQTNPTLPASLHQQPLLESKSLISSSSLLYRNLRRSANDCDDDYYDLNIDNASNIEINNIYESDDDDIQQLLSLNARENHDGMDFTSIHPTGVNSSNISNLITNVTSLGSGNTPTDISPSNEDYNVVSFTTAQQRQLFQKQDESKNTSFDDYTDDDGSTIVATNPRAASNIIASRKRPPSNDQLENEGEKEKKDLTPKTANTNSKVMYM